MAVSVGSGGWFAGETVLGWVCRRSSYIDGVVLRQKDTNDNGTLDTRHYYCQNWRSDVSAIVSSGGKMVEWVKYSAYGIPFGLPGGDTDSDGGCDATDITAITAGGGYDVRKDTELDGDNDAADATRATNNFLGTTLGWNALSRTTVGNRKGYAGYEYDVPVSKYHVRNRVLDPALGRWLRRDPLGYVDGMSLYEYVASMPMIAVDPRGLGNRIGDVGQVGPRGRPIQPRSTNPTICNIWANRFINALPYVEPGCRAGLKDDLMDCCQNRNQDASCINDALGKLGSCNAKKRFIRTTPGGRTEI